MLPRLVLARVIGFILLGSGVGYGAASLLADDASAPVRSAAANAGTSHDPIAALLDSHDEPQAAPAQLAAPRLDANVGNVQWTTTPVKIEPQTQVRRVVARAEEPVAGPPITVSVSTPALTSAQAPVSVSGPVPASMPAGKAARQPATPVATRPADAVASYKVSTYTRVDVIASGLLKAGDKTLRIADVDAIGVNALCTDVRGVRWTCGKRARAAFDGMLRMKRVQCMELGKQGEETLARCQADTTDIAEWLVQAGWASVSKSAGEHMQRMQREAKISGVGQWMADSRPRMAEAAVGQPIRR